MAVKLMILPADLRLIIIAHLTNSEWLALQLTTKAHRAAYTGQNITELVKRRTRFPAPTQHVAVVTDLLPLLSELPLSTKTLKEFKRHQASPGSIDRWNFTDTRQYIMKDDIAIVLRFLMVHLKLTKGDVVRLRDGLVKDDDTSLNKVISGVCLGTDMDMLRTFVPERIEYLIDVPWFFFDSSSCCINLARFNITVVEKWPDNATMLFRYRGVDYEIQCRDESSVVESYLNQTVYLNVRETMKGERVMLLGKTQEQRQQFYYA